MTTHAVPSLLSDFRVCFGTFAGTSSKGPCSRKWPLVTLSVPGGRTQNQNRQKKQSQKMTKLESAVLFLTHQATSCQDVKAQQWQRSPSIAHSCPMFQSTCKHTQQTDTSSCTVIQFAITHKFMLAVMGGGVGLIQKNPITKGFSCQKTPLK